MAWVINGDIHVTLSEGFFWKEKLEENRQTQRPEDTHKIKGCGRKLIP